ncbi:MAG: hypothetical protein LBF97_03455 [Elusimicrobiota bacterium]|nr:hypothetical protein [Elusimicrobiota bacterium]
MSDQQLAGMLKSVSALIAQQKQTQQQQAQQQQPQGQQAAKPAQGAPNGTPAANDVKTNTTPTPGQPQAANGVAGVQQRTA